jgi:hypothetical protein
MQADMATATNSQSRHHGDVVFSSDKPIAVRMGRPVSLGTQMDISLLRASLMFRNHVSTNMVAMITVAVTASAPAIAHGVRAMFAHNADTATSGG